MTLSAVLTRISSGRVEKVDDCVRWGWEPTLLGGEAHVAAPSADSCGEILRLRSCHN